MQNSIGSEPHPRFFLWSQSRACAIIEPLPLSNIIKNRGNTYQLAKNLFRLHKQASVMDAISDSIELVRRDSNERKNAPSGGAVADVRIDVEEANTDSKFEEPRGSLAGHVRVQQKDGSSRIESDGAAERTNRDRDIYWVSA